MTKLIVNAVTARVGGGKRHLRPFVAALADAFPDAQIQVFVPPEFDVGPANPRVAWDHIDVPQGVSLRRLWWDNVTLVRLARHSDAIVSPLNFGPLFTRRPHLLFQRNPLYYDKAFLRSQPWAVRLKFLFGRWLAIACSNRADVVFTPTESMAAMIRPLVRNNSKIFVAPHGLEVDGDRGGGVPFATSRAAQWAASDVKLVHVGHPSDHKNLPTLARTVQRVREMMPGVEVALAVTFDDTDVDPSVAEFVNAAQTCGVLDRVSFLGAVSNADAFALLRHADVLLFPSKSESFGIPVLEAFSVGTAVVASDLDAIAEVASGLAWLHEPGDDERAAAGVVAAIGENGLADGARRARSADFSPERQVAIVSDALRKIFAKQTER